MDEWIYAVIFATGLSGLLLVKPDKIRVVAGIILLSVACVIACMFQIPVISILIPEYIIIRSFDNEGKKSYSAMFVGTILGESIIISVFTIGGIT